jgi:hypothetical protein
LNNLAAMRNRGVITRLFNNPFFATFYVLVYLWTCYAVAFLWHVRGIFKIMVGIVLVLISPDLQDLVDIWRGRPPRV